ncbi:ABC transporter ATP-binding protein (plasmid) [Haloferax mediterranei ATCC 33500]|uniref:ABC transporter ATP-binding protein n=1 Tax=Haloferax mediterranei (strain ATCC 33500 / DSM 1411 / JCM 8866 / NBRC 14739 / NCIMB 2177 / R-4) TaxID=523841 RepID=I3RA42_HALMT|nr:ABC transporter ATP-binding protein [Haloferax mediterranei]AFK21102.1 ABC-type dipeptide/oligopeptide/nickel transport system, ATPase protein II [Haloferax mediterranei ATCC 33500]AHZ24310.1 peptide ABC transporter ATP-binding protein [Haloferax mediterranei ATCC 33500]EMA05396.1 ABC-type dipeptide/oligopeptide/nickel transport system, ATPase protein II [Haloferax mediterranei ATCC 33500]MDX5989806.1 ABC transporter ATP-binding protein [Haloferax mediterranei ATCC 33500]QCQ77249.1 ABC tran
MISDEIHEDKSISNDSPVVELQGVSKAFTAGSSMLKRLFRRDEASVARVVCDVSLAVKKGETVGLVGESGCGKSTLAKLVTGQLAPDTGSVLLDSNPVGGYTERSETQHRRIGVVFQNTRDSFDSRWTIRRSLTESLGPTSARSAVWSGGVEALLRSVNLDPKVASRYPSELSGGQLKRVAIARALAHDPDVIVLDEPVSGLDMATQATILNLLADFQRQFGVGYLFISHDLDVVRYLADRLAVMYAGEIVERGPAQTIFEQPSHPYTEALVRAIPSDNPADAPPEPLPGDPPNPANRPSGCPFHPRCSYADSRCEESHPEFTDTHTGKSRCHYVEDMHPDD